MHTSSLSINEMGLIVISVMTTLHRPSSPACVMTRILSSCVSFLIFSLLFSSTVENEFLLVADQVTRNILNIHCPFIYKGITARIIVVRPFQNLIFRLLAIVTILYYC